MNLCDKKDFPNDNMDWAWQWMCVYCGLCFTELRNIMLHVVGVDIKGDTEIRRKPGCRVRVIREKLQKGGWYQEPKIRPWFEPVHVVPVLKKFPIYSLDFGNIFTKYAFSLKVAFSDNTKEKNWYSDEILTDCFGFWTKYVIHVTQYTNSIRG